MQLPRIAFIGSGNMGRALIGGLIRNGADPAHLTVADPSEEQLQLAHSQFGVRTMVDNTSAVQGAEVVIVAVKPQVMRGTLSALAGVIAQRRALVISVAAGIRIEAIAAWLNGHERIVRTMRWWIRQHRAGERRQESTRDQSHGLQVYGSHLFPPSYRAALRVEAAQS